MFKLFIKFHTLLYYVRLKSTVQLAALLCAGQCCDRCRKNELHVNPSNVTHYCGLSLLWLLPSTPCTTDAVLYLSILSLG